MSEMVERVARAIAAKRAEIELPGVRAAGMRADDRALAEAAIKAMREPMARMQDLAVYAHRRATLARYVNQADAAILYCAMIDAALSE